MASRIDELKRRAGAKGNPKARAEACYSLAAMYATGDGVEQSDKEAAMWATKASHLGHAGAQYNLGCCYAKGKGVEQSYEKAADWYQKAADQGHAAAQVNLGSCYRTGEGVVQSYEKAVEWWQKAAKQGHAAAQYTLGLCYQYGKGVELNLKKAKRFYKLAANQGDAPAHAALARLEAASGKDADMHTTLKHIHKARAALADGSTSSDDKRVAQIHYDKADLASLFRCQNEGCSVAYTDDVSDQTAKKLKTCSRCRKAAYCSPECQTEDWKARHKHECGKRLEVGEAFVLKSLKSRPELNGCRMVVERGMDEATGRVGVRIVAEAEAGKAQEEGGREGDGEERKGDGSKPASAVGSVISVKPANLKNTE